LISGFSLDWNGAVGTAVFGGLSTLPYKAQVLFNVPGKLKSISNGSVNEYTAIVREVTAYPGTVTPQGTVVTTQEYLKELWDNRWAARVENLRAANIIDASNLTNAAAGIFHSDTKQILLDSPKKQITVITSKTEAVAFDAVATPINIANLSIKSANAGALVAVSAMDKNSFGAISPANLINSKRMLVVLSTDAQNSGMSFKDAEGTTLENLGTQPVLVKPVKVNLTLKNNNSLNLKLYSVNFRGVRVDSLPLARTGCNATSTNPATKCTGIEFELDITKLSHGATTYFELSTI
jgi:hypothetical protein